MTKIAKSAILPGRTLTYEAEVADPKSLPYPILSLPACSYIAKVSKIAGYNHASYQIKARLELEDSRDAVPFFKDIELKEEVDLLNEEDDTGEGFIVEGNSVDLDDICLRIIVSSLPIKVVRPGPAKKYDGNGFRLLQEGEEAEESSSPFDKLKDLDL